MLALYATKLPEGWTVLAGRITAICLSFLITGSLFDGVVMGITGSGVIA